MNVIIRYSSRAPRWEPEECELHRTGACGRLWNQDSLSTEQLFRRFLLTQWKTHNWVLFRGRTDMSLAFYFFTRLKKEKKTQKTEKTAHNRDDFKWYKVAFRRIHESDLWLFQHDMYCSISLTLTLILMPHHLLHHLFAKLPFHLFLLYSQCQPPFCPAVAILASPTYKNWKASWVFKRSCSLWIPRTLTSTCEIIIIQMVQRLNPLSFKLHFLFCGLFNLLLNGLSLPTRIV